MTTVQVVEMSFTVNNTPIQDYIHPDDHTQPTGTYEMTHRFKPFIELCTWRHVLNLDHQIQSSFFKELYIVSDL